MRTNLEWSWEKLDENTFRAKVIGGWVLAHSILQYEDPSIALSESMVFIEDKDHLWKIKPPKEESPPSDTVGEDWESKT